MANAVHCTEGPRLKSAAVQCTAYATVHCTAADFSLATIYLSRCGTFHWGWNQRWYNVLRLMRYIVPWLKSRLISAVVQCTASAAVHLSSGDPVFSEQSPPSTWHFAVWVPDFMGQQITRLIVLPCISGLLFRKWRYLRQSLFRESCREGTLLLGWPSRKSSQPERLFDLVECIFNDFNIVFYFIIYSERKYLYLTDQVNPKKS